VALDEDGEAIEDDNNTEIDEGEPCRVWLPLGLEDECVAVDVLSDERGAEAKICNADGDPGEELSDCYEILEPQENVVGSGRDGHIRQERENGGNGNAVDGNTRLAALKEDLGCLAILGDTEEVAGAGVEESVCRR